MFFRNQTQKFIKNISRNQINWIPAFRQRYVSAGPHGFPWGNHAISACPLQPRIRVNTFGDRMYNCGYEQRQGRLMYRNRLRKGYGGRKSHHRIKWTKGQQKKTLRPNRELSSRVKAWVLRQTFEGKILGQSSQTI